VLLILINLSGYENENNMKQTGQWLMMLLRDKYLFLSRLLDFKNNTQLILNIVVHKLTWTQFRIASNPDSILVAFNKFYCFFNKKK